MESCKTYRTVVQSIIDNIQRDGLKRYDRIDVKFMPSLLKMSRRDMFGRFFRYFVLAVDEVIPVTVRKICGIQKTISPTTYTFLGNAYLNIEQLRSEINKNDSAESIMEMCIADYLDDDGTDCWWDLSTNPYMDIMQNDVNKRRTMHIHGLARCNILLLRLYNHANKERYLDIAYRTLLTTLKQHNIRRYKDNTISISYYPYTDDCTLNICSEFCQWLAMVLAHKKNEELSSILHDMIQLLINEQQADGSFPYTAKQSESPQPGKATIDCHHTGTVLSNLICALDQNVLSKQQQRDLEKTVHIGMKSYLDIFISEDDGKIRFRIPGPVQYGEAIMALCKYQKLFNKQNGNEEICNRIQTVLPKLVSTIVQFINVKNGSCPSEKVIFWQHLNSIRWGNGVVLEAVTEYFLLMKQNGSVIAFEK